MTVRLVFAGTPRAAVPSLRALIDSAHDVVAVVTRPDAHSGRGRALHRSPVHDVAAQHAIPVLTPRSPREPEFLARLAALAPDACPCVAYGALLPQQALDIPRLGWVNLHFSLLPAWRGAAPVQHAVISGDELTGATTFIVAPALDSGPVLGTMTETIRPKDTSGDLLARLADAGAQLLLASLDGLADGSVTPRPQTSEGVSIAPKLTPEDGELCWEKPAFAIDRRIRGCTPAPGAWTVFRGQRLKVGPLEQLGGDDGLRPGELRAAKHRVQVGTGAGIVTLGDVQPHGKRPMAAPDWARGVRITAGEVLGA